MTKERLSEVNMKFCDRIFKYGNIKEDYSFRLGSENKRHYVIEYGGYTYYLAKIQTDFGHTFILRRIEMWIRIPNFIGKKLYYKTKRYVLNTWCNKTHKGRKLSTKYYLFIYRRLRK